MYKIFGLRVPDYSNRVIEKGKVKTFWASPSQGETFRWDKTSSWHLNGFPDGSNIGPIV